MNEIQDALLRMVRAWRKANKLRESYLNSGLNENELFQVCAEISEAIYALIGEHSPTFAESITELALTVSGFDDEHRVRLLMNEYRRNHPEQPAPHFISRDDMRKSVKKNGGYLYETPEGDWT